MRQVEKNLLELHLIRNTGWVLRVVLKKLKICFGQIGVESAADRERWIAGFEARHSFLDVRKPKLVHHRIVDKSTRHQFFESAGDCFGGRTDRVILRSRK